MVSIRNAVAAGITLLEAISSLEHQLLMNGLSEAEAKSRANHAGDETRKLQDEIYIERDPRIAIKPKKTDEKWYLGPREGDYLWPRYKNLLINEKSLTPKTVEDLDTATTRIVSQLGCPGSTRFRKQGLVVGRVQSGKTSNFMGVLAKAGDAGYRIIIVLAGTTNALRYQTQDRLQKDLVKIESDSIWQWLTEAKCNPVTLVVNPNGEFNEKGNATSIMGNISARRIAVIKKNSIVLKRVRKWLEGVNDTHKGLCPVLLVDDECDNASVNTRREGEDPAEINKEIRNILMLLPKVSYVGYTATPFANVLINPKAEEQDLYPKDFLFALPLNPEYFGPERIFGRSQISVNGTGNEENDIVREITIKEVAQLCPSSSKTRDEFTMLETESLQNAIRYFLMSTAARCWREKNSGLGADFKTMLINTAQYVCIHRKTKPIVTKILADLALSFDNERGKWQAQWEEEIGKFTQEDIGCKAEKVLWKHLVPLLTKDFFEGITVIVSNSDPNIASNLNICFDKSKKGAVQIIIGGNTLSRGITLEGLSVSYFVRTSTTYDTLLQMGRWFGYRNGYEDMPRIWMTKEMEDKFLTLSEVEYEMFQELSNFMAGKSPSEIGLRIRKSPGMQITAKAKMYHAEECEIDYEGFCVQTKFVHREDKDALLANKAAVEMLIRKTGGPDSWSLSRGFWLRKDVTVKDILEFFAVYKFHEKNQKADQNLFLEYIKKQNQINNCKQWNIAIKTKTDSTQPGDELTLSGLKVNKFQFSRLKTYEGEAFAYLKGIRSRIDIFADAANPQELERLCSNDQELQAQRAKYEDGRGLIIVYPIRADSQPEAKKVNRLALDAKADVFGLAVFFPGNPTNRSGVGSVRVRISPAHTTNEEEDYESEPII
jgi:hypothetical protein